MRGQQRQSVAGNRGTTNKPTKTNPTPNRGQEGRHIPREFKKVFLNSGNNFCASFKRAPLHLILMTIQSMREKKAIDKHTFNNSMTTWPIKTACRQSSFLTWIWSSI